MYIVNLFSAVLKMSAMASILIILILATKWLFKTKFSPRWHYAIWLLLIVKLIVPYAPMSSMSILNLMPERHQERLAEFSQQAEIYDEGNSDEDVEPYQVQQDATYEEDIYPQNPLTFTTMAKKSQYSPMAILGFIWLLGAVILLSYMLYFYKSFIGNKDNIVPCNDRECIELVKSYGEYIGIRDDIEVYWSLKKEISPCVVGVFRPKLILPIDIYERLTDEERTHILLHELAHIKRWDNVVNNIALILSCLHWFNPIIWYAFYRMRNDCELACDYYITKNWNIDRRRQYGYTLIHATALVGEGRYIFFPVGMSGSKRGMKRRIESIMEKKSYPLFWVVLAVIVFLVLGIVGLTSTDYRAPHRKDILDSSDELTEYKYFQRPNIIYLYQHGKFATIGEESKKFERILELLDSNMDTEDIYSMGWENARLSARDEKRIKQDGFAIEFIYNDIAFSSYKIGSEDVPLAYYRLLFHIFEDGGMILHFGSDDESTRERDISDYYNQNPVLAGPSLSNELDELEEGILSKVDWKATVIKYDDMYRLVEKEQYTYVSPNEKIRAVSNISPGMLVKVKNAVKVGRKTWLEVAIPVYDTPSDMTGWIQENQTKEYTEKSKSKVLGDVYIDAGTSYYESIDLDKQDRELKELDYDLRGYIEERRDGYVKIFTPGALEIWVEEKDIRYPPVE